MISFVNAGLDEGETLHRLAYKAMSLSFTHVQGVTGMLWPLPLSLVQPFVRRSYRKYDLFDGDRWWSIRVHLNQRLASMEPSE